MLDPHQKTAHTVC